jgi:hypothetical protein
MGTDGLAHAESSDPVAEPTLMRHRRVPTRVVGDTVIAAEPRDGAPVTMVAAAAVTWLQLDDWTTTAALDLCLSDVFPEISMQERVEARNEILSTLESHDFLERS